MWANAQRDGRPAEYRWRRLFIAAKFGWHPLVPCSKAAKTRKLDVEISWDAPNSRTDVSR